MNQKEKQYALDRISQIANQKIAAIKLKHTKEGVSLTSAERLAALKNGDFKVRPGINGVPTYAEIKNVFIFTAEKAAQSDDVKIEAEIAKVGREATRIKDQLMLGDSQEALQLIEQFSK